MISTDTNLNRSTQLHQTSDYHLERVHSEPEPSVETNPQSQSSAIFQAVGIVTGSVNLNSDGKNTVTIGSSTYRLFYLNHKRKAFEALGKEIETTSNLQQRLIVYPRAIHFPTKERRSRQSQVPPSASHEITFQLVGFDKGQQQKGVSRELIDLEFKLSGLWQFIPVCRTPCISIFRNFSCERLDYIKQAEPAKKVKFLSRQSSAFTVERCTMQAVQIQSESRSRPRIPSICLA